MKLSKTDALLLHAVLFDYVKNAKGVHNVDAEDLLYALKDFLTSESSDDDEDGEDDVDDDAEVDVEHDEDEDDEEDEVELPDVEGYISPAQLAELKPISVVSPAGDKVTLEFEDVGNHDSVDALVDEGTMIIEGIVRVKTSENSVDLFDGEEWHVFTCKKVSKLWMKTLKQGIVYGLESESDEEEE